MPKTSLYSQFEIKPVRILFLKSKHVHFLASFQVHLRYLFTYFSETLEESFKESQLVQSLHKLLQDDNTSPEVIYNSMGLLCSLLNSGNFILSCLWWKNRCLWWKHKCILLLKCAACNVSQWVVKDIKKVHSLLITKNPSKVASFFMKSWLNHKLNEKRLYSSESVA